MRLFLAERVSGACFRLASNAMRRCVCACMHCGHHVGLAIFQRAQRAPAAGGLQLGLDAARTMRLADFEVGAHQQAAVPQQAVQLANQGQSGRMAVEKNQIQALRRDLHPLQHGQKGAFVQLNPLRQTTFGNMLARQLGVLRIAFQRIDLRAGAGQRHEAGGVAQARAQFQNALRLVLRQQLPQARPVIKNMRAATMRLLVQACGLLKGE